MELMKQGFLKIFHDFFSTQPVEKAWIFGSYARGEETPESDIDIMVKYLPGTCLGLFGIAKLTESLEALLGKRVDLVEQGYLYPRVANAVESEKIQVYERES